MGLRRRFQTKPALVPEEHFPERRPIGGVRGSLMSVRQKKSYWVGREASRELARNQSLFVPQWRKRFLPPDMPPDIPISGGIQGSNEALVPLELCWERIKDKRFSNESIAGAQLVKVGAAVVIRRHARDGAANGLERRMRCCSL